MNAYFKRLTGKNWTDSIQEQFGVQTELHSQIAPPDGNPSHTFERYFKDSFTNKSKS